MSELAKDGRARADRPEQVGGSYDYDWVGNMKAGAPSNAWQYNAADQLTLWPGMHSYSYDDNGALTAVKTADGQTEQQTFTYHPNGLMNQASFNNETQTLANLWDADEHRVRFSVGEDEYTAVFDVTAGIPAVIKEITPTETIYYVREPGGELICRVVETTKRYYHFDELGSTRAITDGSGAVTDRYSYDAYGAVISHDRNTGTIAQPYQYVGQFGYYTHYDAPEFGWLQLGVRFYEPETGRFERRDRVVAKDHTRYDYSFASPLRLTDPHGYWPTLYAGASCKNVRYNTEAIINWVSESMRHYFDTGKYSTVIGEAITRCTARIMVQCWSGYCQGVRRRCGFGNAITDVASISYHPGCPNPACTLLHEVVHVCGIVGHFGSQWNLDGGLEPLIVQGCGDLRRLGNQNDYRVR